MSAGDVLEGKVIGRCVQRHRHQEFIRFLNAVEREVPVGKPVLSFAEGAVHAILDNYATHKHPKVIQWLFLPRMPKGAIVAFDELNCESFPGETLAFLESIDIRTAELKRSPIDPWISYLVL